MKRTICRKAISRLTAIGLAFATGVFSHFAAAQDAPLTDGAMKNIEQHNPDYSPYPNQHFPNRVFWGDTHHHTRLSFDDGLMGTTLGPEEAYRFARGEEVLSNSGQRAKLSRPLDFLVVSDHAEYLGLADLLNNADPDLLATEVGKSWYDRMMIGGREGSQVALEVFLSIGKREELYKSDQIKRSVWEYVTGIATKYNEPGKFTAFNGFEWTSSPGGDNLHRVVIFRDGPDRVNQVLPISAFDSENPEDLWKYLAAYESKTGGEILAIPHNGNTSNGKMFALADFMGTPLTRAYAEKRARWEPLMEVTQTKGDSETHPFLSPEDEFASFERWDFGNFANPVVPKQNEMLEFEYARSGLKLGLMQEAKLGVNPFKFGMIGSTDTHTGMSSFDEDNFFGKIPSSEPSPERWDEALFMKADKTPAASGWMLQASGIAGIWARENTREALFDAMKRKEVYASTGPRITVRLFAGWDFNKDEIEAPDFAARGYARGVPMGGDLNSPPAGKSPAFMVRALRDPDGGNLDRIQMVKGWLDEKGEVHEHVYDIAVSDDREIGPGGRCATPVGDTVDIPNATFKNTIGDPLLSAYWKDPEFDPAQRAFYYVRVIQIPTPRWTAYDQKRFGIKMAENVPMKVTDRAYTSPIWYTP
ncbi:DUF3604 domain-containing protein [Rhizobium leguminosarum]|uniref:DUF3604 domain-containing protein n=1 Tax=Rhizobium leguminosarum TaxID=384 RepID=UPI001030C73F|nr:DUF3604 domain-containing protein [Rhizobium leguminosarum]TAX28961.1 DUF3604 domain-containing protein [Rhizobium leguminosarum]